MCGICGFVGNGNKSILINMREKMVHRGPDDAGIYLNLENQIGLGHRRLSIIDLSERGRQPMASSSGENVITYNGEVYNYLEIKRELEKNGIYFRSNTDTEVVLEAIQYWGIKAINKFHGMFAIAIWNKSKKELLLIRDRLGIKPLYYSITQSGIVFASEIKALLEHPEVPKDLNYNALDCYLKVDYIPGNRTIFKYVHKLLPAHYLTYKQGDININKYWNLRFTKEKRSVTSWMDELEDEILSSVKARMIADVPIGAFLSGGIDSTIILTAMARISKEPVKTFTIGFTDDMYDESQYAKFVAERNNAKSYYKIIEPQIDFDLLKRLIYQADEPLADGSLMPTYLVCKASKDYAKVI
ncbi:MAG: asparagine synthase (glutamine-hydrolyzing), partial [Candidatus Neomarinimicrobiota bacterium]|nr:asparagine synthase (glutamine-hydrolyzing) [Candidatus Neomarinimicrobiota bacterium]